MIGYKLLRPDGRSLSDQYGAVHYPLDGSWIEVPGRGAFIGASVSGLLRGGFGPLLVEVEYADVLGGDEECPEVRRVRVVRTATIDLWTLVRVACRAARDVAHLSSDPRALAAIEAAERCERERTTDAARAVNAASWAVETPSWAVEAVARAVAEARAPSWAAAWAAKAAAKAADVEAAEAAARAAARAVNAASWAVETPSWAVEAVARAVARAVAWAAAAVATSRTRARAYLIAEAWPTAT